MVEILPRIMHIDWFEGDSHNELLSDRPENGSYCYANPGKEYAVYFPIGEAVTIDLSAASGELKAQWLNISNGEWRKDECASGKAGLVPPSRVPWAVVIS